MSIAGCGCKNRAGSLQSEFQGFEKTTEDKCSKLYEEFAKCSAYGNCSERNVARLLERITRFCSK